MMVGRSTNDATDRIIDNLVQPGVKISVTSWARVCGRKDRLEFLIDAAFRNRRNCAYDLSQPMRRYDS